MNDLIEKGVAEFTKKFHFGVNCERCWGDVPQAECRCDENVAAKEEGERIKSFLRSSLLKMRQETLREVGEVVKSKAGEQKDCLSQFA